MDDKAVRRWSELLDKIGYRNLLVLPDDVKEQLKNTTNIYRKIEILEKVVTSWEKQGLI